MKNRIIALFVAGVVVIGGVGFRTYSYRTLSIESARKTYENLKTAVSGEVTAKNKYIIFAEKAAMEGNKNTQKLFLATADAENIHIKKEYNLSNEMMAYTAPAPEIVDVLSSAENLQSCINGEKYESKEMYPIFLEQSDKENFKAASKIFRFARDAEASHAALFIAELERLRIGGDPEEEITYYLCPVCGKIEVGKASIFCDVCGTPGLVFKKY